MVQRFLRSPSLAAAVVLLSLSASAVVQGCKPGQPSHAADHDRVVAAQKKWCATLAGFEAEGGSWRYQAECEAAFPMGSADFVSLLSDCYRRERESFGDQAPDSGALVSICTEQVLAGADPGAVGNTALSRARCERQQRCSGVAMDQCQAVFARIDPTVQAMLTSMYNLAAQAEIAECLQDTACSEDEDRAHDACYAPLKDRRVWFPL